MTLKQFTQDERGQDVVEYSLLTGLIGLAVVAMALPLLGSLIGIFQGILEALGGPPRITYPEGIWERYY